MQYRFRFTMRRLELSSLLLRFEGCDALVGSGRRLDRASLLAPIPSCPPAGDCRLQAKRKAGWRQRDIRQFVCFQIQRPDAEPVDRTFAPVGIDMGLTRILA